MKLSFVVSENISIANELTTAGSKSLAGYKPLFTASAVERLAVAGFNYTGRASVGEFGTDMSGLARAVMDSVSELGLGSDTNGEIVLAAKDAGLYGYRPTYGAVSRLGLIPYASSFDTVGIVAKTYETLETAFITIADKKSAGILLGSATQIPLKTTGDKDADTAHLIISSAELVSSLLRIDGIRCGYSTESFTDIDDMIAHTRGEGFSYAIKTRIMLGNYVLSAKNYDAYFKKALTVRANIRATFSSKRTASLSEAILAGAAILSTPENGLRAILYSPKQEAL